MIVKRPSKQKMPDLKRCEFDDHGLEDDYVRSVYSKKRKTATLSSVTVDNPGQCDDDAPKSSSFTEGSSFGEETESVSMNKAVKSQKTSRRWVQVLPSRFNDSVVRLRKNNKSKSANIESGLYEIYLKRRDNNRKKFENFSSDTYLVKKEFKEEKLSLPSYSYHPYCQNGEEDRMGSFAVNNCAYSKSSMNKWNSWPPFVDSNEKAAKRVPIVGNIQAYLLFLLSIVYHVGRLQEFLLAYIR